MTEPVANTPIRAALERLHQYAEIFPVHDTDAILAAARAALAEPDGPAVPESREPASVVGEPSDIEQVAQQVFEAMRFSGATSPAPPEWVFGGNSLMQDHARDVARALLARWGQPSAPPVPPLKERPDFIAGYREGLADGRRIAEDEEIDENCWQWYTYCPEEGLEMYSDRKQAQSAAQSIMGSYEVAAHSDGWHEDMELVSWGMLVPVEQAQVVERKTAEPDDEFDEWVKYELRPVRWGHQPAPPAEGEVGELVAFLTPSREQTAAITFEAFCKLRRAAELLQQQQAELLECRQVAAAFEKFNQQRRTHD